MAPTHTGRAVEPEAPRLAATRGRGEGSPSHRLAAGIYPNCLKDGEHMKKSASTSPFAILALALTGSFFVIPAAHAQFPGMPQPKHYAWSDTSVARCASRHGDQGTYARGEDLPPAWTGDSLQCHGPPNPTAAQDDSVAIPRVGIPAIQMADSAYGVTRGAASGRYSTALPNNLAAASVMGSAGRL